MSEKHGTQKGGPKAKYEPVVVIHGGAGIMDKSKSTPKQREMYRACLRESLTFGYDVLKAGGNSSDAAVAAVACMEGESLLLMGKPRKDCSLFNSAKGAVFNVAGKNELEASIMLSKPCTSHSNVPKSRRGFSATLLTQTKNPSKLVQALYARPDLAPHAFLSGATAEVELGQKQLGIELVDPSYFWTEHRWREHRRGLGLPEGLEQSDSASASQSTLAGEESMPPFDLMPKGTVGAVALDAAGCITVVTSTGGKTNKLVGRIGDTPSMGSGFWAEEWEGKRTSSRLVSILRRVLGLKKRASRAMAVGISGTGDGDYFIRQATCSTMGARMKLLGESVQDAATRVVEDLRADGGLGGVIALDINGNVAFSLNCSGMYRGYIKNGIPKVAIFDDDILE